MTLFVLPSAHCVFSHLLRTTSANIELEVLKAGNTESAIPDLTGKEVQRWNVDLTPYLFPSFRCRFPPRGIYLLSARGEGATREQRLILE